MKIGINICNLRKEYGLTQGELAEKIGVTEQSVSKWENDKCSPDLSLLPALAGIFNCSVDRILGIESDTYGHGVRAVLEAFGKCNNYNEEIELMQKSLLNYPNNNDFKLKLARSYFMAWRMSKTGSEKNAAFRKVVNYCENVISQSNNISEIDRAYDLLVQLYAESGDYENALQACNKLSVNSWNDRLYGNAQIYKESKNYEALTNFSESTILALHTTMRLIYELYINGVYEEGKYNKALQLCMTQEKLLSLFDTENEKLYLTEKMMLSCRKASIYKRLNSKNMVYEALSQMSEFAKNAIGKVAMTEENIVDYVNIFTDKFGDILDEKDRQEIKL